MASEKSGVPRAILDAMTFRSYNTYKGLKEVVRNNLKNNK